MNDRDRAIQWARNVLQEDFVILDSETTGLGYDDEAVSIAVIDKEGNPLIDTLLHHQKESHPKALAVHGHTWEDTREAPRFPDIWDRFVDATKDKVVVIYNANFDIQILQQMIKRYSIITAHLLSSMDCVMEQFAIYYGEWSEYHGNYRWQTLSTAAYYFGIDTSDAHGALADCKMTLEVVKGMAATPLSTEKQEAA